ncbi:genetic competence negative regulator [Paenibacillus sp.]|uniref:genetic competence negative regulator n=1 Tax=Paenibacillus sp. TaxID=58172 RepID=UPI002D65F5EC|nr:genetic competence negative regulator [Paenibacillus sp.]HZG85213.1 genetic competence negative regulator [Paenibacillus sp.]
MKIERLGHDKIRIFLTFDDLTERGIQKDDMWREIPKVHELFNEMMDQAYSEFGFETNGPLAVEVFAMPAQGMVVIVTKGKHTDKKDPFDDDDEDVFEMEVTLEESDLISYTFRDIEHLISAAKRIGPQYTDAGVLYSYQNKWVLQLEYDTEDDRMFDNLISVLSEFGEPNSYTDAMLEEYGKVVIAEGAIGVLRTRFQ